MDRLKLPETFRGHTIIFVLTIFVAVSIMAAGTFAWLSLVQRMTNEFEYEPNTIRLIKVDSKTGERLEGATFKLYDQYGNHVVFDGVNDISSLTTDNNGEIIVRGLKGNKYYFVETEAPEGYKIQAPGVQHEVYQGIPGYNEVTVKNIPTTASLTIKKAIASNDLAGKPVADNEKLDPFEFMVIIKDEKDGQGSEKAYNYTIYDKDGAKIKEYPHTTADGKSITITSGGTIKSGESIWLRDGDYAVIDGVKVADYYIVTEEDTAEVELKDLDAIRHTEFECDSNDPTHRHSAPIGTYKGSPWASFSENAAGYIGETGSVAQFTNIKVPPDYQEITISSLVVIDRIVDEYRDPNEPDYLRRPAGWDQVDFTQPFEVKITLGGDPRQRYFYEVVYIIDEEHRPKIAGADHEHTLDYYHANDPHIELNHSFVPITSDSRARSAGESPFAAGLFSIAPSAAPTRSDPDYFAPLHKPSEFERWGEGENRNYGENTLKESTGNEITVELHHQAAVIIYGIPTFTSYTAEQVEHFNNGYIHHSNYLTKGVILPDLERVADPNYEEYGTLFGDKTRRIAPFDLDGASSTPDLLRTRADIFNYYPSKRDLTVEKIWDDNNNANGKRPSRISVTVTGRAVGRKLYEQTLWLPDNGQWEKTIEVPEYYSDGVTPIIYEVTERQVSGYKRPHIEKMSEDYFVITNSITSDSIDPDDPDPPPGGTGIPTGNASLTVTKTVNGGTDKYKQFDFTVTIGRYKYKIKLAHGQRYTFTDIPVGTRYSVSEASYAADGYSTTSTGSNGTISPSGNTAAFVNTKGEAPQSTVGSLTISKNVAGWFVDATKKFRFIVQIGDKRHEVFLKHGESTTFEGIPVGTSYTVTEDDYAQQEYITSSTGATGTISGKGETAAFVNEYVGKMWPKPGEDAVQISGKKTWIHGENANPPESITVFVMEASTIVAKKTVTAKEGWRYAFNLPKYNKDGKEIIYSINEDTVKDYFKTIKGYDLENAYNPTQNPGTGDMKVIWIWFIAMLVASIGLRTAVFYRKKRKQS